MSEKRPYPFIEPEELHKAQEHYSEDQMYARMYGQSPTMSRDRLTKWQDISGSHERHPTEGYVYPAIRREGETPGRRPIETYHGESFIEWIDQQIAAHPEAGPLHVLDVGGGIGLYTEQLRKQFGDKVRVYSTGLRKAPVRLQRAQLRAGQSPQYKLPKNVEVNSDAHPDDLKWRSILQLSDFEEFNLIVDTAGEFAYTASSLEEVSRYILAVIHKLLPGGKASIGFISESQALFLKKVLADIEKSKNYQGTFSYSLNQNISSAIVSEEPEFVLKIEKLKPLSAK